jgi:HD-GYP domain-containing protein (c-di-GMP phosphodiesterase class II)
MSDAISANLDVPYFGISRALKLFGRDVHNVGAYNFKVGDLVSILGRLCGFNREEAERWREAASLHDLGKLWISPSILLKPGALDENERRVMQDHVVFGYAHLSHLCTLAAEIALSHHENYDGTGYPYALKGEEIPLSGRMARLCDVYDALRAERPYKKAMTHDEAVGIILHGDNRVRPEMFDPELLALFARHHQEFEVAFHQ